MADYSMVESALQVADLTNSVYVDQDSGEIIEGLKDSKFPWREWKKWTLWLADIYDFAGLQRASEKLRSCSTWLQYFASADLSIRQLNHYNACKQRLCPLCSVRKARIMALRLEKVLEKTLSDHKGSQAIFLTLTIENVSGDKLRSALDELTVSWRRLTKRRPFDRAVKGWFRAIEVTRNRSKNTYHPHIHAILIVESDYFKKSSGLYINQADWVVMWQQSLRVSYKPIVGVERTRSKNKKTSKARSAVVEAAKYSTKPADFISKKLPRAEAAEVVRVYTQALYRKRMTALGGWMLDASRELDLDVEADDADLVHDDDGAGELTAATAALIEDYGWHFGVADHLLLSREPNPDYEGNAACQG